MRVSLIIILFFQFKLVFAQIDSVDWYDAIDVIKEFYTIIQQKEKPTICDLNNLFFQKGEYEVALIEEEGKLKGMDNFEIENYVRKIYKNPKDYPSLYFKKLLELKNLVLPDTGSINKENIFVSLAFSGNNRNSLVGDFKILLKSKNNKTDLLIFKLLLDNVHAPYGTYIVDILTVGRISILSKIEGTD